MPQYLSPGVYIEELDVGPHPIQGVSTSTTGMVGVTVRGPTDGKPVLVTNAVHQAGRGADRRPGSGFALREGIEELIHPSATSSFAVAYIVLAISTVLDLVSSPCRRAPARPASFES